MSDVDPGPGTSWVAGTCTLPSVDQPLRQQEWDGFLRSAVHSVTRTTSTHASFRLRAEPAVAAQAADLIVRETQCCSFFTFTVTASEGRLGLEITVPPEHRAVLTALVDHTQMTTDRPAQ